MAACDILADISDTFFSLTTTPEKTALVVLLLHDVTGLKKKDIRKILEYGPQLAEIYSKDRDFRVNKGSKVKIGVKTKAKKWKA